MSHVLHLFGGLALLIPLGILGVIRWTSWLIRRMPAALYKPIENGHKEPLSIVVPVYQEDPATFRQAIESWLANPVKEIICVIDVTDQACISVASEYPIKLIQTEVPGKRDALRVGWEAASTPLVALVDADTIWATDVADKVCMPFVDPKVGGVAPRQNVADPRTPWQHLNDMYLDYRYFDEIASQSVIGRAISCLSGRTAVYRRELLLQSSSEFMNETFLGVPCMSGDDKRLTTLVLARGYATVLQRSARVWATFPPDALSFFKQRLRWARNTWRSDLRSLASDWVRDHRFLQFGMIDKMISPFTLLVSPTLMVIAAIHHLWPFVGLLALWWLVSRSAKMLPHLGRRPRHFFTMMPFMIVMSFAMGLVKIAALLTIRRQRWLTRGVQVSARTKKIVRTGAGAKAHPESAQAVRTDPLWGGAEVRVMIVALFVAFFGVVAGLELSLDAGEPSRSGRLELLPLRPGAPITIVSGDATLPVLANVLSSTKGNANDLVERDGWWELRRPILVEPHGSLTIDGERLRLVSGSPMAAIEVVGGTVRIADSTVTSWDPVNGTPDQNVANGRPWILARNGAHMDVIGSTLTMLGYNAYERYGVAWRTRAGGTVQASSFDGNYFGLYTYGADPMHIADSIVTGSREYGLDLHSNSNGFQIIGNHLTNNGKHGLILAVRCSGAVIRNNIASGNRGDGFVLFAGSNDNLLDGNESFDNTGSGIDVSGSSRATIQDNIVHENGVGLTVHDGSTGVSVSGNRVAGNLTDGILLSSAANGVHIQGNVVDFNQRAGVYVDDGSASIGPGNTFLENLEGVWLSGSADDVSVLNNSFDGTVNDGIYLTSGVAKLSIRGNVVANSGKAAFSTSTRGEAAPFLAFNRLTGNTVTTRVRV